MKNPKEKAKEIVNKFMFSDIYFSVKGQNKINAKQCAIICCEEVIDNYLNIETQEGNFEFWNSVIEEIKKL